MAATQIFFTSYARLDNRDGKLAQAVEDLRNRVSAKVGEDTPIFFDTSELKNGVEWQNKLGQALKEIRVAVCLCSPSYLKSAFCAKEFEIFRHRVDAAFQKTVAIIPVVWEPVPLPEVIRRFHQPKDPRFPSDYYMAGLYKLSTLPSQRENFLTAIEALANDVDSADQGAKLPPYEGDVVYDQLPDFFHNPKPDRYGVMLTVLNDKRSQWRPGVRNTVGALMDAVADSLRVAWEDVPPDPVTLLAHLTEAVESRLMSIYVIGRDDLARAPWQQMVEKIGQANPENAAIVVGWKQSDLAAPADIRDELQKLLPSGIRADYFPLDDEQGFKETLKKTIQTVRMALIAKDEAAKVIAPQLRNEAVSDGIPVDSISTVQGPGPS